MAAPGYTVVMGSVALVSSTTKSVAAVISAAQVLPTICEISIGFDSASTTGKAAVQLCQSTQAGAGTPTSTPTPTQIRGKARTASCTTGTNYSAEPTVLSVVKEWLVDITTGFAIQFPLGREVEPDTSGGTVKAYVLRIIPPAVAVNCRGYLEWEE